MARWPVGWIVVGACHGTVSETPATPDPSEDSATPDTDTDAGETDAVGVPTAYPRLDTAHGTPDLDGCTTVCVTPTSVPDAPTAPRDSGWTPFEPLVAVPNRLGQREGRCPQGSTPGPPVPMADRAHHLSPTTTRPVTLGMVPSCQISTPSPVLRFDLTPEVSGTVPVHLRITVDGTPWPIPTPGTRWATGDHGALVAVHEGTGQVVRFPAPTTSDAVTRPLRRGRHHLRWDRGDGTPTHPGRGWTGTLIAAAEGTASIELPYQLVRIEESRDGGRSIVRQIGSAVASLLGLNFQHRGDIPAAMPEGPWSRMDVLADDARQQVEVRWAAAVDAPGGVLAAPPAEERFWSGELALDTGDGMTVTSSFCHDEALPADALNRARSVAEGTFPRTDSGLPSGRWSCRSDRPDEDVLQVKLAPLPTWHLPCVSLLPSFGCWRYPAENEGTWVSLRPRPDRGDLALVWHDLDVFAGTTRLTLGHYRFTSPHERVTGGDGSLSGWFTGAAGEVHLTNPRSLWTTPVRPVPIHPGVQDQIVFPRVVHTLTFLQDGKPWTRPPPPPGVAQSTGYSLEATPWVAVEARDPGTAPQGLQGLVGEAWSVGPPFEIPTDGRPVRLWVAPPPAEHAVGLQTFDLGETPTELVVDLTTTPLTLHFDHVPADGQPLVVSEAAYQKSTATPPVDWDRTSPWTLQVVQGGTFDIGWRCGPTDPSCGDDPIRWLARTLLIPP